ncbi:hypothetical protein [Rhodoplanes roseus]|nr:hypothetical protein [Rhodoplanes roseus]
MSPLGLLSLVMAGLVPVIHDLYAPTTKTWMAGTRPTMTGKSAERRP